MTGESEIPKYCTQKRRSQKRQKLLQESGSDGDGDARVVVEAAAAAVCSVQWKWKWKQQRRWRWIVWQRRCFQFQLPLVVASLCLNEVYISICLFVSCILCLCYYANFHFQFSFSCGSSVHMHAAHVHNTRHITQTPKAASMFFHYKKKKKKGVGGYLK